MTEVILKLSSKRQAVGRAEGLWGLPRSERLARFLGAVGEGSVSQFSDGFASGVVWARGCSGSLAPLTGCCGASGGPTGSMTFGCGRSEYSRVTLLE